MRGGLLLVCLTACRFHFDPVVGDGGDDGDPTGEAAVVSGVQVPLSTTGTCTAVAWSGDRAGVVWREAEAAVWFATVDTTGTVLDAPFAIGTGLNVPDCPAIAWTEGQFLVAIDTGPSLADVQLTAVSGTSASSLMNVSADSGLSLFSEVAYHAGNAMVAWQNNDAAQDVVVRRVTPTGTIVAATLTASGLATANGLPSITWDGTAFSVFWIATSGQIHSRVFPLSGGAMVEQVLTVLGAANEVVSAWNGGGDVMLAWPDLTRSSVSVARMMGGAVVAGPTTTPALNAVRLDAVWTGSRFGVVYLQTGGPVEFRLAQFNADTSFIDDTPIFNASTNAASSLAWAGDRYVMAVDNNPGVLVTFVMP
jgi:hypothetical protein